MLTVFVLGEAFPSKLVVKLKQHCPPKCAQWNGYGPAETTLFAIFHRIDVEKVTANDKNIPIGRPMTNYKCHVLDEFLQPAPLKQIGELYMGGIGVFAGYLGRDDLTSRSRLNMDDEFIYKTGDLVRIDDKGLLHFIGRKDFQVKIRGQRIELGEIECCLMEIVSNCVIIKHDEKLVAYVQAGMDMNEDRLRVHCQSHLPLHMIPSIFIIMEQFPLNSNGKIDRKSLPEPQKSSTSVIEHQPKNEIEERVHSLWCSVLSRDRISTMASFFAIGGHSLLLMELYQLYQFMFVVDKENFSINAISTNPTIAQHAQLLQKYPIAKQHLTLHTLNIVKGNSLYIVSPSRSCLLILHRNRSYSSGAPFHARDGAVFIE